MPTVSPQKEPTRILIVGGGFGGVRTALNLRKQNLLNVKITLLSDRHHFEYTPAYYKIAAGTSPMETCIPLSDIFPDRSVEIIVDTVVAGDTKEHVIFGASGSRYRYDYLVLALGSETAYFGIPGIKEHSYSIKTINEALRLKAHIHEVFNSHHGMSVFELMSQFQFVIIGGGPAGVELAGVLRPYLRTLARIHQVPERFVTVNLLQGAPRLLPTMNEEVSLRALKRLDSLGINILMGKAVASEDAIGVYLKDIGFSARTIIWTAGVKATSIYEKITGLTLEKNGRIVVNESMMAVGVRDVFVLGDSASTPFAGTAQTAIYDGEYIAKALTNRLNKKNLPKYDPKPTPYVVPVGNNWAIFTFKNITFSGRLFFWLREIIDLRFFMSILPFQKAWFAWRSGGTRIESCPTCKH